MAITFPGTPSTFEAATSAASIPLSNPGAQNGDMLVAFLRTNGSTSAADFALAGWTRRGYTFRPSDGAGRVFGIYTHPVTDAASEPATYTFTKAVADGRRVGIMVIARGVDLADPILGNSANWNTELTPTISLLGYTLAAAVDGVTLFAWANEATSPNAAAPTATPGTPLAFASSAAGTGSTRTVLWVGQEPVNATSQPSRGLTWASSTGAAATGVTLRAAATTTYEAVGTLTASGTATASVARRTGFASVAHMLETPGATIAWRVGGGPYPQHSAHAAAQSDLLGFDAMEFSCGWTSDLVPFGLGPQYLDSIAGVTGSIDPTTMTWAQLTANYVNKNNPVSPGVFQPFWRLEDFLTAYAATHICVVDPKFGFATPAKIDKMLDICDAHGGPSRIMLKFDNPTSNTEMTTRAHARGYLCMNYWGTDTATMATQQGAWDALGVLYSAPSPVFTDAAAHGKPVWAAVVPDQAGYNAARANGAQFMNVSGVTSVTPIGASSRTGAGTLTATGTAPRTINTARTATGALTVDGTATRTVNVTRAAVGEILAGGTAARVVGVGRAAVGVVEATGSALATANITRTAIGVLEVTGRGQVEDGVTRTAVGVVTATGDAARTIGAHRDAVGVLLLTGVGLQARVRVPEIRTLTGITAQTTLTPLSVTRTLEDA